MMTFNEPTLLLAHFQLIQKGKIILKAVLVVAAITTFVLIYDMLRSASTMHSHHVKNQKHEIVDIRQIYFLFACFILFLVGMPILSIFKTFCDFIIGWIMHIGVLFLYLFFFFTDQCSNYRSSVQTIGQVFKLLVKCSFMFNVEMRNCI